MEQTSAIHVVTRRIGGTWRRYADVLTDTQLENAFIKGQTITLPPNWRIHHIPLEEWQNGSERTELINRRPLVFVGETQPIDNVGMAASVAVDIRKTFKRSIWNAAH